MMTDGGTNEDVKPEVTLDLQAMLSDVSFKDSFRRTISPPVPSIKYEQLTVVDEKYDTTMMIKTGSVVVENIASQPTDYKLLRQVLKDTSFQEKYNLRAMDVEGLGTIFHQAEVKRGEKIRVKQEEDDEHNEEEDVRLMIDDDDDKDSCPITAGRSLIFAGEKDDEFNRLLLKDNIDERGDIGKSASNVGNNNVAASEMTDVNMNLVPVLSQAIERLIQDVEKTSVTLGINKDPKMWSMEDVRTWLLWNVRQFNVPVPPEFFNMDGRNLASMTEQEFQRKYPLTGVILYAQLEVWKAASMEDSHLNVNNFLCDAAKAQNDNVAISIDITDDDDEEDEDVDMESMQKKSKTGKQANNNGVGGTSNNNNNNSSNSSSGTTGGYNSHIHLWQFLKELLSTPDVYASCIRWIDVNSGVFKIEDSVRVAKLWGKRKNRPAMNYDKLSRSIRQYYKKGIMKKTERSQRLVYQFCPPYNIV